MPLRFVVVGIEGGGGEIDERAGVPLSPRGDRVVRHCTAADLDTVVAVLGDAFAEDPLQRWLLEPAADFDAARVALFRFFLHDYFWLGHTWVLPGTQRPGDIAGAALWSPPDRNALRGTRIDDLIGLMSDLIGEEQLGRIAELAQAGDHRPAAPHFYLGILGVADEHRGAGLGATLVEPVLEVCDRTGLAAHLESSNPRNLGFYQRLGFQATAEFRCGNASGPLTTIMTRPPGAR